MGNGINNINNIWELKSEYKKHQNMFPEIYIVTVHPINETFPKRTIDPKYD